MLGKDRTAWGKPRKPGGKYAGETYVAQAEKRDVDDPKA